MNKVANKTAVGVMHSHARARQMTLAIMRQYNVGTFCVREHGPTTVRRIQAIE